jgi:hypothetical protein
MAIIEDHGNWTSGLGPVDDVHDLWNDFSSGDYVGGGFDVAGTAIDVLSDVIDPLGGVIGCAVGWAFDHISFLRTPVDWLAGDAEAIEADAQTWAQASQNLSASAQALADSLANLSADKWSGEARAEYQKRAENLIEATSGAAGGAAVVSALITATGAVCATFRAEVISWISNFCEKMAMRGLVALANSTWTFGGAVAAWVIDLEAEGALLAAKIETHIQKLVEKMAKVAHDAGRKVSLLEKLAKQLDTLAKRLGDSARALRQASSIMRGQATRVRNGHNIAGYVRNYAGHIDELGQAPAKKIFDVGEDLWEVGSGAVNLAIDPNAENLNDLIDDLTGIGADQAVDAGKDKWKHRHDHPAPH